MLLKVQLRQEKSYEFFNLSFPVQEKIESHKVPFFQSPVQSSIGQGKYYFRCHWHQICIYNNSRTCPTRFVIFKTSLPESPESSKSSQFELCNSSHIFLKIFCLQEFCNKISKTALRNNLISLNYKIFDTENT